MPFTRYAVETFLSPKATSITRCGARDISLTFPDFEKWISMYGVRVIFTNHVKVETHHFALQFLRQTIAALTHYRSAFVSLNGHVEAHGTKWTPYFEALSNFEDSISRLYQALDCSRKVLNQKLFEDKDGSKEQRLNSIYNVMRHNPAQLEQPVWITDIGLESAQEILPFPEIEEMLSMCGRICQKLAGGASDTTA